jgi:hypothetical protein
MTVYFSKGFYDEEKSDLLEDIRETQAYYVGNNDHEEVKYRPYVGAVALLWIIIPALFLIYLIYKAIEYHLSGEPIYASFIYPMLLIGGLWGLYVYLVYELYLGYDYPPKMILTSRGVIVSYEGDKSSHTQFIAWKNVKDITFRFGYMEIEYLKGSYRSLVIFYTNMNSPEKIFKRYKKYWTY